MSEATKDTVPAQTAGDQDMQAPRDSTPPLSAEEADLVASQFKPAWEDVLDHSPADHEARRDAPDSANEPAPSDDQPAAAALESDETQPPQTTQALAPEEQGQEDVAEPQGPVDIIAAIPKRTEIEIKDEPTVVVPEDDPFEPVPVVPAAAPSAAHEDHDSDRTHQVQRQRRNRVIVLAVVAIAAVIGGIGGLKVVLSSGGEPSDSANVHHDPTENTTSAESLPVAPDEPAAPSPEPTAVEQPPPTAPTPSAEDAIKAAAEPVAEPPPDKTSAAAKTAPRSTEQVAPKSTAPATTTPPTTTAPEPPKTAEPKPPKTASPPATDKPPSGGIVRETPF